MFLQPARIYAGRWSALCGAVNHDNYMHVRTTRLVSIMLPNFTFEDDESFETFCSGQAPTKARRRLCRAWHATTPAPADLLPRADRLSHREAQCFFIYIYACALTLDVSSLVLNLLLCYQFL